MAWGQVNSCREMQESRVVSLLEDNAFLTALLQGFSLPGFFAQSASLKYVRLPSGTFAQNTIQIIFPCIQTLFFLCTHTLPSPLQGKVLHFHKICPLSSRYSLITSISTMELYTAAVSTLYSCRGRGIIIKFIS